MSLTVTVYIFPPQCVCEELPCPRAL